MSIQQLTLISRSYCHLCHDMELALASLLEEFNAQLIILDVDADPLLEQRYDELVPVLLKGDGSDHVEICHYYLDETAVREYLTSLK